MKLPFFFGPLIWIGLAGALCLLLGNINVPIYYRLMQHGQAAQGVIASTNPKSHCAAVYRFQVNDQDYTGENARCDVVPGQSLTVYYDPANPAVSTIHEPRSALGNELIPIALACLVFPSGVVYQLYKVGFIRRRKRGAQNDISL